MKKLILACFIIALTAACSTPGPVTARPDNNVSTSGTTGSVKATDGPPPERQPVPKLPDTSTHKQDPVRL